MPYFQHYSFDLWLTLIRSDPYFKDQRARYFHKHYNLLQKTLNEVAQTFRQVDLMCNAINEKTGKNIDADEMYLMVIDLLNNGTLLLEDVDAEQLYQEMERLLFLYPPIMYADVTLNVLEHLKYKSGASISLLSNTGFITGKTLRKVLGLYGLHNYFDFQLYSDEAGLSKPNHAFFNLMLQNIAICNPGKIISLNNIIHVGDNAKNDIKGAEKLGIRSLLINSNENTILSLIR